MKGVIFNLLEEAMNEHFGEEAWNDLVDAAGVDGIYTSLGSYPDEEILALVATAAELTGQEVPQVLEWFGRAAMPFMARRYPLFFDGHSSARTFVLSVNQIIHPEVRKLYSGAGCPHFHFDEDADGNMLIGYNSARQMCRLAHGFVEGAADYYNESVELEHVQCMHDGGGRCVMRVEWR